MSEENKALVRRWFAEIDKGNWQIVDELIAVDYTRLLYFAIAGVHVILSGPLPPPA